ncbi:MAG: hypothetical protein K2J64_09910 [Desulfovibrio sp.]|nr:hypothetical protein [Desulfovibrio sp.]
MAVLSERVLRHLAKYGPSYTRQIASALGVTSVGVWQVCKCLLSHGLLHTVEGRMHGLTAAGKELAKNGGWIPCQRAGRAATSRGRTLRQRAWNVLRMAEQTTVPDLLRVVCEGDEERAEENLRNYCRALYLAGILGKTRRTGAYFLRCEANTGDKAPAYNRESKTVTDRNTGRTVSIAEAGHA